MDDITKINNDADLSRYLARIPATPYKQGHKKMLTDLINYAVEHQWTLRTLADKLPVSTTVHAPSAQRYLPSACRPPSGQAGRPVRRPFPTPAVNLGRPVY